MPRMSGRNSRPGIELDEIQVARRKIPASKQGPPDLCRHRPATLFYCQGDFRNSGTRRSPLPTGLASVLMARPDGEVLQEGSEVLR